MAIERDALILLIDVTRCNFKCIDGFNEDVVRSLSRNQLCEEERMRIAIALALALSGFVQ